MSQAEKDRFIERLRIHAEAYRHMIRLARAATSQLGAEMRAALDAEITAVDSAKDDAMAVLHRETLDALDATLRECGIREEAD